MLRDRAGKCRAATGPPAARTFPDTALLTWTELQCDAEGACVARLSEGDGADADGAGRDRRGAAADALAVDEATGRAYLIGALDVLVPELVSSTWPRARSRGPARCAPRDADFDHLLLTAAGGVTAGSCEGRAEGVWVLR